MPPRTPQVNNPHAPLNSPAGGGGPGRFREGRHPRVLGAGALADSSNHVFAATKVNKPKPSHGVESAYVGHLKEAVRALGTAAFGKTTNKGKYDQANWRVVDSRHPKAKWKKELELKPHSESHRTPGQAILEIVRNPTRWSLDCGEFVQVVHLYALVQSNAGGFDRKYRDNPFYLRPHYSTGIEILSSFSRIGPNAPWLDELASEAAGRDSNIPAIARGDQLIEAAPLGACVGWSRGLMVRDYNFNGENSIKLGQDRFGAHPFVGRGVSSFISRADLEAYMYSAELHLQERVGKVEGDYYFPSIVQIYKMTL